MGTSQFGKVRRGMAVQSGAGRGLAARGEASPGRVGYGKARGAAGNSRPNL